MSLPGKESTRRNCNGAPHSEDNDSISNRSFKVRSLERSYNTDLLSVKFNSPPPKPPRRRNSGQRVVTPTGCSSPKNCSEMADETVPQQNSSLSTDPAILAEEVKVLREMNDQLWKHLCSTQSKLDQLQNANLSSEPENGASSPSFADLLTSVYYAQKEKEEMIESRLQVALTERDAAIHELEDLVEMLGRNFQEMASNGDMEDVSGKTLKELLKEVETTQDPTKLMQQQHLLLAHLYRENKSRQSNVPPELKLALVEKNNALSMIQHLEEELHHWKHSTDGWHKDTKQWESSLLDILCQVISQRDSAYQKVKCLQEEINALHSRLRQQKITGDMQLNSSYEGVQAQEHFPQCQGSCRLHCTTSMGSDGEDAEDQRKAISYCGSERKPGENNFLKTEVLRLTQSLQLEMKARQIAEESCRRLERLVCVLRKKVNGLHVGVQV